VERLNKSQEAQTASSSSRRVAAGQKHLQHTDHMLAEQTHESEREGRVNFAHTLNYLFSPAVRAGGRTMWSGSRGTSAAALLQIGCTKAA